MTDFIAAAAELDVFSTKFRNLLAVAEELRRVGSLQQAGNEAQARLDQLTVTAADQVAQHQARIDELHAQAEAANVNLQGLTAAFDNQRNDLNQQIDAKKTELAGVDATVNDLKAQEAALIQTKTDIVRLKSDFDARSATFDQQIEAKQAELAEAERNVAETKARHDELVAAIDALKAKLLA